MKHVFITGCPRSGTTMLASILGNTSDSVVTPESHFFNDFIYKYLPEPSSSVNKIKLIDFFNTHYRFKQWGLDAKNIDHIPEHITIESFDQIIESTIRLFAEKQGIELNKDIKRIDHTPSNIKDFNIINKLFPESKYIFIIRDPRAVFASIKHLDWGPNTPLRLSEIWLEYTAYYFSVKNLIPDRIQLVRYEDLLVHKGEQIQTLCHFIDTNYKDELLSGEGFQVPEYTYNQHSLVGKALDKTRIDKWKEELNQDEVVIIDSYCKVLMSAFGYEPAFNNCYKITTKDKMKMLIGEILSYIPNKFKKKVRENNA